MMKANAIPGSTLIGHTRNHNIGKQANGTHAAKRIIVEGFKSCHTVAMMNMLMSSTTPSFARNE